MRSHSLWFVACVLTIHSLCTIVASQRIVINATVSTPYGPSVVFSCFSVMHDGTSTNGGLIYLSTRGCALYRISGGTGAISLVAGGPSEAKAYADGVGGSAKFFYPTGIVGNANNKIAFVSDRDNYRIRQVNLATNAVTTLAGSGVKGGADGVGTSAQFSLSYGITFSSNAGGVLYVADAGTYRIRKIVIATAAVTTLAQFQNQVSGVAINSNGNLLMVVGTCFVARLDPATTSWSYVAGAAGSCAFSDGVGSLARFTNPVSATFAPDESGLIITDYFRLRWLQLSTMRVFTIAGTGASGLKDGQGLLAQFMSAVYVIWHCNGLSTCGVLVSDYIDAGSSAIRFVAIDVKTMSLTDSPTDHVTTSRSINTPTSSSGTSRSVSDSITALTATFPRSASQTISIRDSPTRHATTSRSIIASQSDTDTSTLESSTTLTATLSSSSGTSRSTTDSITAVTATFPNSVSHTIAPSSTLATAAETVTRSMSVTNSVNLSVTHPTLTWSKPNVTVTVPFTLTVTQRWTSSPSVTLSSRTSTVTGTARTATPWSVQHRGSSSLSASTTQWRCEAAGRMVMNVSLSAASVSGAVVCVTLGSAGAVRTSARGAALTTWSLTTMPLEREVLMRYPPLAVNITLAAPVTAPVLHWTVWNVSVGGVELRWTCEKSVDGSWHFVTAAPLDRGGWLGDTAPLMANRVVELVVVLACGGEPGLAVTVRVLAPRYRSEFVESVTLAAQISQILSIVSGSAASGSAVGRALATKSVVICDVDTAVDGGVADLRVLLCVGGDTTDLYGDPIAEDVARSAVISNLTLVAIVAAALSLLSVAWCALTGARLLSSMGDVLCMPSSMLSAWTAAVPSAAAALTLLSARLSTSRCASVDGVLVVGGLLLSLTPAVGLAVLWIWKCRRNESAWICVRVPTIEGTGLRRGAGRWFLVVLLRRVMRRMWKWRTSSLTGPHSSHSLRFASVVLLEYRLMWYPGGVDQGVLVAVSVLAVLAGLDVSNRALCIGSTATIVALLVVQAVVTVRARPFTTLFALVYASVTVAVTCLGVFAQLMFIVMSSSNMSGLWLVDASAVCSLFVVGLSTFRMVADLGDLLSAVWRRVAMLLRPIGTPPSPRPQLPPPPPHDAAPCAPLTEAAAPPLVSPKVSTFLRKTLADGCDDDEAYDDRWIEMLYWTSKGQARVKQERQGEGDVNMLRTLDLV